MENPALREVKKIAQNFVKNLISFFQATSKTRRRKRLRASNTKTLCIGWKGIFIQKMFVFVNLWKFQTPTVPGSPGQNYERTRAKKSALQKLNERRASWALDQKQEKNSHPKPPNLNGSGDQLDPPPILSIPHIEHSDSPTSEHSEQAPISARKRWDSPSKTVVNNFQGTQNK